MKRFGQIFLNSLKCQKKIFWGLKPKYFVVQNKSLKGGILGGQAAAAAAHAVWPDGNIIFSIFCHLEQWKFAYKYKICAKVGSQFCQILNSRPKPF